MQSLVCRDNLQLVPWDCLTWTICAAMLFLDKFSMGERGGWICVSPLVPST